MHRLPVSLSRFRARFNFRAAARHALAAFLFGGLTAIAAAQTLASNTNYTGQNLSGGDYNRQNISFSNFTGADLSGSNFEYAGLAYLDFTDANLSGVNFWMTRFNGTTFAGADLRNAVFNGVEFQNVLVLNGANLSGTNLSGFIARGNFTGANLSNANLVSTNFSNANLTNADVSGANFTGASLFNTNLSNSDATKAITVAQLKSASILQYATLRGNNFTGVDLGDLNLTRVTLSESNFTNANGSAANFSFATLASANFTNGNFSGANFSNASFTNATFSGADFSYANLRNSNVTGQQLAALGNATGIDLAFTSLRYLYADNARLNSANFTSANLADSYFRNTVLTDANFSAADLSNAIISGNARNANFSNATLSSTWMTDTDLRGANFSGALMNGTALADTDLRESNISAGQLSASRKDLSRSNLSDLSLKNANLKTFYLSGTNFSGADLTSSDLTGARAWSTNFTNADLTGVNFTNAELYGTILTGAKLNNTWLTAYQLSGVNRNLSGIVLNSRNLASTDFSNFSFANADLSASAWGLTSFASGDLFRTNFNGANLTNANFGGATLDQATFTGANLTNVSFYGASMRGTSVLTHQLSGVNFATAYLENVTIGDASRTDGFVYAGQLTLNGSTLTLASAGRAQLGSLTTISYGTIAAAHGIELPAGSTLRGNGTISTPNTAADTSVLNGSVESTNLLTFTGHLSGNAVYSGGITLHGTLQLSGTVQNLPGTSGTVSLEGGALHAAGNASTARSIYVNSGTMSAAEGATLTTSGFLWGNSLRIVGAGTVALAGSNYLDHLQLDSGTLRAGSLQNAWNGGSTIAFNGGTLQAAGSFGTSRPTTLEAGGATFDIGSGIEVAWNGAISGEGSLTKIGAGTLLLGGASTYTGDTWVNAGILRLMSAAAFNEHTTVHVAEGATFDTNGFNPNVGGVGGSGTVQIDSGGLSLNGTADETFAGKYTGSGALTVAHNGTLTLTGQNDYAGGTTVDRGTLELAGGGTIAHGDQALSMGYNGPAHLNITAGSLTAANGYIGNANEATLTVDGENSSANVTNIYLGYSGAAGHLNVSAGATLTSSSTQIGVGANGVATVTGADSTWNNSGQINISSVGKLVISDGGTVNAGTFFMESSGNTIAGNGASAHATTLYLGYFGNGDLTIGAGGTSTHTTATVGQFAQGKITVDAGGHFQTTNLNLGSGGTLTVAGTTDIDKLSSGNGAKVDFTHSQENFVFDTQLGGRARLIQNGTGTTTLTGTNNGFTGTLEVNAGALVVNGHYSSSATTVNSGGTLGGSGTVGVLSLANGATLAPGNSPGTLNAGNTTLAAGGNYAWEINDAAGVAGTNWDLLNITGTLTFSATEENPFTISLLTLASGNDSGPLFNFNSGQNHSYTIATASGGIFGFNANTITLNLSGFSNDLAGGAWSIAQSGNNLNLLFTAAAIPEPSTYAALFGALALLLAARRRQRA